MNVSAERCQELLSYCAETGKLTWACDRVSGQGRVNVHAGDIAGSIGRAGYRIVRIDGKNYRAHRVIWLMAHGDWPEYEIDHINGNRDDNRISNLRHATRLQNAKNVGLSRRNKWGSKGVSWDSLKGSWRADICADGRARFLGNFATIPEARAAYSAAALELHGEFGRAA
jgi:hypothetical protein